MESSQTPGASSVGAELDPDLFRRVFGHFPTGVAVLSAAGESGPIGMTANAVCSLSLEPMLVLACFDNGARTLNTVGDTKRYGINLLRAEHDELCKRFASKMPEDEKFAGVLHQMQAGVPVITDSLAWLACDLVELIEAGDHTIGIGKVIAAGHDEGGEPLVWYRGDFHALHEHRKTPTP